MTEPRRLVGSIDTYPDAIFVGTGTWMANPFRAYEHCKGEDGDWGVEDTGRLCAPMGHGWTEEGAKKAAVTAYRNLIEKMFRPHSSARFGLVADLRGRDLVCTCTEGMPCHGDVLLEVANDDDPFYDPLRANAEVDL